MGLLTKFLVMYVMLNMLFIMVQAATLEINPSGTEYYDCSDDFLSQFDQNHCQGTWIVETNASAQLPSGTNPVTEDQGSFFTDTFNSIKTWLLKSIPGASVVSQLLSGPGKYISLIFGGSGGGVSASTAANVIPGVINAIWYILGSILIITWMKGGDA